ncbi:MAG: hypothetical protein QOF70_1499, partial [Acetobacteraceae bacterium]|nr:hypothetical protein [Acetobacteraceae bacterium]
RLKNIDVRIGVLDAIIARHKGPVRAGSRMESRNFGKFLGTLSASTSTSVRFYIAGPSTPYRMPPQAECEAFLDGLLRLRIPEIAALASAGGVPIPD